MWIGNVHNERVKFIYILQSESNVRFGHFNISEVNVHTLVFRGTLK